MGVLDGLKSRFGGNNNANNGEYADDYDDYGRYDDGYDDYNDQGADYGYGASDGYESDVAPDYGYGTDDGYAGSDDQGYAYDAGSNMSRGEDDMRARAPRAPRAANQHAPLISSSDVRSSSALNQYDRQPTQRSSRAAYGSTASLDDRRTPTASGSSRSAQSIQDARSELESLKANAGIDSSTLSAASKESLRTTKRAYTTPYESNVSRRMTTVVPTCYEDVAQVAQGYKGGSAVVLSLTKVDAALAKRLLDFSFGVASALDGTVSKLNARTFLIAREGVELEAAELDSLKSAGVI